MSSFTESAAAVDKITDLLIGHSLPLADTRLKSCKKKNKHAIYVKLPADIKIARSQCKTAFDSWKDNKYSNYKKLRRNQQKFEIFFCKVSSPFSSEDY